MTLSGRPAWIAVALLVVSLCVNALLGGVVLGWQMRGPGDRGGFLGPRLSRDLTPEARATLKESFRERHDALRARFGAVREARRRVAEALATDPPDRAAVSGALATLRQATEAAQAVAHEAVMDGLLRLPPETREAVWDHWSRRHGDGDRAPPPPPPSPSPTR